MLFVRLARAGADAGQRQRRAHQLQESAAADRVEPLRRVLRKLAVQEFLEFGRLRDSSSRLRQYSRPRVPSSRARSASMSFDIVHERVTGGTSSSWCCALMPYSFTSCGPSTDCGTGGR